jgi:hypothetical protein
MHKHLKFSWQIKQEEKGNKNITKQNSTSKSVKSTIPRPEKIKKKGKYLTTKYLNIYIYIYKDY